MPQSDLTRAEVRDRLLRFAAVWDARDGREQQEAQQFLVGLLRCYGVAVDDVDPLFEQRIEIDGESKRADLLWKEHLLIEMKSASETDRLVEKHADQVFRYWEHSYPHPTYVVLCSFRRLVIFEPGRHGRRIRQDIALIDLPDQLEALDVLRGNAPNFDREAADLEREAVQALSTLHRSLIDRGVDDGVARDFTLQATWCLFAEDLGMFGEQVLTETIETMLRDPAVRAYDPLGQLFGALSSGSGWPPRFADVPFANGGLFATPAHVALNEDELQLLHRAASSDWRDVQPAIFGGLLQSALGEERRNAMGAHYTPEAEIQKIIGPTIVEPWEQRIAAVGRADEASAVVRDLAAFRVLDPACGCGNFLYVTYRELRRLHRAAWLRLEQLSRAEGRRIPDDLPSPKLENMLGIEKDQFAVALARVVLWIGHKMAIDRFDLADPALPLPTLDGIAQGDALKLEWPATDAIVGNPPFHGSQNLRKLLGDEEITWLKQRFGIGVKDYCVYWFRRAQDHLQPGQRAGLIGTNSISQNRARGASLEYVIERGGVIVNAISSQVWPGDAAVHVSLVNWVNEPDTLPKRLVLDGVEVEGVTASLTAGAADGRLVQRLAANTGKCFQGPIPVGDGFLLLDDEAQSLIARTDASYRDVVRPYLVGKDVTTAVGAGPTRWVIDFASRELREARQYPAALEIVEARVRPEREQNAQASRRQLWWLFGARAPGLRAALAPLPRYFAGVRIGKRILFAWQDPWTCPSDLVNVFAFDDDYHFGILTSRVHTDWAKAKSSTLKGDIRYTPTTAFQTFPFPEPTDEQREQIAVISRDLNALRDQLSRELGIGLTTLYNQVDEGDHRDLVALHRDLDRAVCGAYGWPARVVDDPDERNRRLLELNHAIADGQVEYDPFPLRDERGTASLF